MRETIERIRRKYRSDGGNGSGNWNKRTFTDDKERQNTSFSKLRSDAAKPHKVGADELNRMPGGTKLIAGDVTYTKNNGTKWKNDQTDLIVSAANLCSDLKDNLGVRLAIPGYAIREYLSGARNTNNLLMASKEVQKAMSPTEELCGSCCFLMEEMCHCHRLRWPSYDAVMDGCDYYTKK